MKQYLYMDQITLLRYILHDLRALTNLLNKIKSRFQMVTHLSFIH